MRHALNEYIELNDIYNEVGAQGLIDWINEYAPRKDIISETLTSYSEAMTIKDMYNYWDWKYNDPVKFDTIKNRFGSKHISPTPELKFYLDPSNSNKVIFECSHPLLNWLKTAKLFSITYDSIVAGWTSDLQGVYTFSPTESNNYWNLKISKLQDWGQNLNWKITFLSPNSFSIG